MPNTPIGNQQVSMKWKTVFIIIISIIGFFFGAGAAYSIFLDDVADNKEDIEEMKPLVEKIPLIEYKLDSLSDGQDEIKSLIKKTP